MVECGEDISLVDSGDGVPLVNCRSFVVKRGGHLCGGHWRGDPVVERGEDIPNVDNEEDFPVVVNGEEIPVVDSVEEVSVVVSENEVPVVKSG